MKQKGISQNSVLDERTRALIFGDSSNEDLNHIIKRVPSILPYSQCPLTDLAEINERLDTIGAFVQDQDLRNAASDIMKVFGFAYDSLFKELVQYRIEFDKNNEYYCRHYTGPLAATLCDLAKSIGNMPVGFGIETFKTRTLEDLAGQYEEFVSDGTGHSPGAFFYAMMDIGKEIGLIEGWSESDEKRSSDDLKINAKQLAEILYCYDFSQYITALEQIESYFAAMSPFVELATEAVENSYNRPEVVAKQYNCLIIKEGRFDLIHNGGEVIPNDTSLDNSTRVEVLEGVNNGGKTIDIKKAIYLATKALSGSWVPGSVRVSVRDHIILREKGTGDAISGLQQDCRSAKETSPNVGEYWLIGMDETFTSTERNGGAALTYGLCRSVLDQGHSVMIISSHYPGLYKAFEGIAGITFNHFPFKKRPSKYNPDLEELYFPYTKEPGPLTDFSYAIALAEYKDFDSKTITYAKERLASRDV